MNSWPVAFTTAPHTFPPTSGRTKTSMRSFSILTTFHSRGSGVAAYPSKEWYGYSLRSVASTGTGFGSENG